MLTYSQLSEFQREYLTSLLWSSGEFYLISPEGSEEACLGPYDELVTDDEIDLTDKATLEHLQEVEAFRKAWEATWEGYWGESSAAHDLALTRNHHGAGFWDRFYPSLPSSKKIPSYTPVGSTSSLLGDFQQRIIKERSEGFREKSYPISGCLVSPWGGLEGSVRGKILTQAAHLEGSCMVDLVLEEEYREKPVEELKRLHDKGASLFSSWVIVNG